MSSTASKTRFAILLLTIPLIASLFTVTLSAQTNDEMRTPTQAERDYYASSVLPALNSIKRSLPTAPPGWTVFGETRIDPAPRSLSDSILAFRFTYQISYRRVAGIKEERKALDDAYIKSATFHEEAARPQIQELIKQQTEASLALRKATRRKKQSEMQRLNDVLDENGRKLKAVHEAVQNNISQDTEQLLIKDAEVAISIAMNDDRADFPHDGTFSFPNAAFALRKEGIRTGPTTWKEGQTLILFGDWSQQQGQQFIANEQDVRQEPKARTIKVLVTGDKKQADELLKRMNLKLIRSLMK